MNPEESNLYLRPSAMSGTGMSPRAHTLGHVTFFPDVAPDRKPNKKASRDRHHSVADTGVGQAGTKLKESPAPRPLVPDVAQPGRVVQHGRRSNNELSGHSHRVHHDKGEELQESIATAGQDSMSVKKSKHSHTVVQVIGNSSPRISSDQPILVSAAEHAAFLPTKSKYRSSLDKNSSASRLQGAAAEEPSVDSYAQSRGNAPTKITSKYCSPSYYEPEGTLPGTVNKKSAATQDAHVQGSSTKDNCGQLTGKHGNSQLTSDISHNKTMATADMLPIYCPGHSQAQAFLQPAAPLTTPKAQEVRRIERFGAFQGRAPMWMWECAGLALAALVLIAVLAAFAFLRERATEGRGQPQRRAKKLAASSSTDWGEDTEPTVVS
ncbi:uncharacterized protein LOC144121760 [Amblyomma americanum]